MRRSFLRWLEKRNRKSHCDRKGHLKIRPLYVWKDHPYESETDYYKRYRCDYCKVTWSERISGVIG